MPLWCSGHRQGVACTCRLTGFDFRRRCFLFLCTVFFCLFGLFILTLFFLLALFSLFLLLTVLVMHLDQYISNLSLSPEFYFGKGILKALDMHIGQSYDQKKTIRCQEMSRLKQLNFFSMLVDIMTNKTQYTTNCTNLHPTRTHQ